MSLDDENAGCAAYSILGFMRVSLCVYILLVLPFGAMDLSVNM